MPLPLAENPANPMLREGMVTICKAGIA